MLSRGNLKRTTAAIVVGILVGGGVTTVTPAGAEVEQFAATNWKKIWKKKLQPKADKRYYTKAASDARYTAAGAGYSKAEADAKYAPAGSSYTKAEADAKYAPIPSLIRGTTMQATTAAAAGAKSGDSISWGVTLSAAPTAHYIKLGDPIPLGCSGTPAAPVAEVGHLCVFENFASNNAGNIIATPTGGLGATTVGAVLFATAAAAGDTVVTTAWAVRPAGFATGLGGGSAKAPHAGGSAFGQ